MAMTMTVISNCEVAECSYNVEKKCHTMAITVGDSNCPMCDTFLKAGSKGGDMNVLGGVGACKAADCKFNEAYECSATLINVGKHSNHADCKTYSPR